MVSFMQACQKCQESNSCALFALGLESLSGAYLRTLTKGGVLGVEGYNQIIIRGLDIAPNTNEGLWALYMYVHKTTKYN